MKYLTALLTAILFTSGLIAGDTFRPFQFNWTEVAPDVWSAVRPDPHRHPVLGSTTVVIGKTGVIVYDGGGLPVQADQVIEKINSLTDAPVTHVIISHWHGDHNFGVYRFADTWPEVEFVTHAFTDRAFKSQRIRYIDRYPEYLEKTIPGLQKMLDEDDPEKPMHADDRYELERIVRYKDQIAPEFMKARVPDVTTVMTDDLVLDLDGRSVEIKYLGHGNTQGDIIMWLPDSGVVATGDLVVHPSPYAFNMPPRALAQTLQNLNGLDYKVLVPGHGDIQHDKAYVDLLIRISNEVADKRDALLAEGVEADDLATKLDLSHYEAVMLGDRKGYHGFFDGYFAKPFIAAAVKELKGGPMVELKPVEQKD